MKSILVSFLSVFFFTSYSQTGSQFIATGDVSSVKDKPYKVYFSYKLNGEEINDSALVKDNQYTISGKINEPVLVLMNAAYIDTSLKYDYRRDYKIMHITPGDKASIMHKDSFSLATIKGSFAHDEFLKLEANLSIYNKKISALWQEIDLLKAANDTTAASMKLTELKALAKAMYAVYPKYINENPSSPIAIFAINQYRGPFLNPDEIEPLFNALSPNIKNTYAGKELFRKIEIAKRTTIGKIAPIVTQKDSLGNIVSLNDLKGKYVLMEFWASWCKPCREENPNLVKTYNKYKGKGFEIFGISVDENRKSWLNAVKKDGLNWINTANMLGTDRNPAALTYGVEAIPNNYLVDPQGKIIGSNLRGQALEKKLEEIFGDKRSAGR